MYTRLLSRATLAAAALLCALPAGAVEGCGPLPSGGYGPYDYRGEREKVTPVEKFHFTPAVEALLHGATGHIGGDLEYTLDKIPNHHRALMALDRLSERSKKDQIAYMSYPVDCYFDRALRFRPDDTVVRVLFAIRLIRTNRPEFAEAQLAIADEHALDNPLSHLNIGLVYFDLKDYDKAAAKAERVQALGGDSDLLVKQLQSVGHWPEPKPVAMPELPAASGVAP